MESNTSRRTTQYHPKTAVQILETAASIIAEKFMRRGCFDNSDATKEYLSFQLNKHEREVFAVMLLDTQHRLIEFKELFWGTVDSASVYPREIVKAALAVNAGAVILAHNHPSGVSEPSEADKQITQRIKQSLALVDIRVLDHVIVGEQTISMAEIGCF